MVAKAEGINLLPHLTKAEVLQERKKSSVTLGTATVTLIVALGSVALVLFNMYQGYSITGINLPFFTSRGFDSEIVALKSEVDTYREVLSAQVELATKVDFVEEVLVGSPDYQRTLGRLQALLPGEVVVDDYEITEFSEITISGEAKDYYTLALFISRAQKPDLVQGYFSDFDLERASFRDNAIDFSIIAVAVFPEESLIEEE